MSGPTVDCLGCGRELPLGQSRCRACQPPKTIPGYRAFRAERPRVLAEGVCWICRRPGTPDDPLEVDHVVPRSKGGTHRRTNLRAAHESCNRARGNRPARRPGIRVL